MVNTWGQWTETPDMPVEKMCWYDYMAKAVRESGYKIKTTMENLLDMIWLHGYDDVDTRDSMTLEELVQGYLDYVEASGGFEEFDYEC